MVPNRVGDRRKRLDHPLFACREKRVAAGFSLFKRLSFMVPGLLSDCRDYPNDDQYNYDNQYDHQYDHDDQADHHDNNNEYNHHDY